MRRTECIAKININRVVIYKKQPYRIIWFFFHWGIAIACLGGIIFSEPLSLKILSSLLLGHSLGCLMLIAHEIIHRSIFKNKYLVAMFGTLSCIQFGMTWYVWQEWHNKFHHKYTQQPGKDPDCWGYVNFLKFDKVMRFAYLISPGSKKILSYFYLFFFFTIKTGIIIFWTKGIFTKPYVSFFNKIFFILVHFVWIGIALYVGKLILIFILPFLVMNFIMMMYICTNHFVSQVTPNSNETLLNTLTVEVPKIFQILHVYTNFHVEHHLFPSASPVFYPMISEKLKEHVGNQYKTMPLWQAILLVYSTPRMYKSPDILIDPKTGKTAKTVN